MPTLPTTVWTVLTAGLLQEILLQLARRGVRCRQRRPGVHADVHRYGSVVALRREAEGNPGKDKHHDEGQGGSGCDQHNGAAIQEARQGFGIAFPHPLEPGFGPAVESRGQGLKKAQEKPPEVAKDAQKEGIEEQGGQEDEVLRCDQHYDGDDRHDDPRGFSPRRETPAHRFSQHSEAPREIPPVQCPVGLRGIGEAHREKEHCFQQREAHRGCEPEGELPHEISDNAADEADGNENGEQGQSRGDHRAEDLARPLQDGLFLAEAHDPVALHVFRDDDRIIDNDADRNDHGEHRHEVQGEAGKVVEHGRRRESDRDGENHRKRGVELAKEEEDDQSDDDGRDEDLAVGRGE